jgi:hypothetical protein
MIFCKKKHFQEATPAAHTRLSSRRFEGRQGSFLNSPKKKFGGFKFISYLCIVNGKRFTKAFCKKSVPRANLLKILKKHPLRH